MDVENEVKPAAVWEKAESRSQRGGVRVREQGGKHCGSCDCGFTLGMIQSEERTAAAHTD